MSRRWPEDRRRGRRSLYRTQRLIIPPGLVGPDDVTVVQIPRRHEKRDVVVARPHLTRLAEEKANERVIDHPDLGLREGYQRMLSSPWGQRYRMPPYPMPYGNQGMYGAAAPYPVLPPGQNFYGGVPQYPAVPTGQVVYGGIPPYPPMQVVQSPYAMSPYPVLPGGQMVPKSSLKSLRSKTSNTGSQVSFAESVLDRTEQWEREKVQNNLESYQQARRQFLKDAIVLAEKIAVAKKEIDDDDSDN